MLKQLRLYVLIILSIFTFCCEKQEDDTVTEQKIFASLLPEMVEAVYKDPEVYLNFQEAFKHAITDSLYQDPPNPKRLCQERMIISVSETLNPPHNDDIKSMQEIIKTNKLNILISDSKLAHKLVLPSHDNERYVYKYLQKYATDKGDIYTDGINTFHISISFSRIQFDEKKEYGILTGTFDCQPKCGIGYIIVVRKTSAAWEIYKVFDSWVS